MRILTVVVCHALALLPLSTEIDNRQASRAFVFASGLLEKGGASIMLSWHDQMPEPFYSKLRRDSRVTEFFSAFGAKALGKR
jgi:hypothetical protein